MSEEIMPADQVSDDPAAELRAQTERLEQQLAKVEQESRARVVRAELKVEAVRAGIIDLDGLKLLDTTNVEFTAEGEVANAAQLVAQLRRAKPWLFGSASSSNPTNPPPAQPPRQKLATEMTDAEYRAARAAILRHRG